MKYYVGVWAIYNNGECIDSGFLGHCLTDNQKKTTTYNITWENLDKVYQEIGFGGCGFSYWNLKKGRVISFFNGHPFNKNKRDIKEWKTKELNLSLVFEWHEINPTMEMLFKMDADKVQKFLKERE